jgi:hypothetical protein
MHQELQADISRASALNDDGKNESKNQSQVMAMQSLQGAVEACSNLTKVTEDTEKPNVYLPKGNAQSLTFEVSASSGDAKQGLQRISQTNSSCWIPAKEDFVSPWYKVDCGSLHFIEKLHLQGGFLDSHENIKMEDGALASDALELTNKAKMNQIMESIRPESITGEAQQTYDIAKYGRRR